MNRHQWLFERRFFLIYVVCSLAAIFYLPYFVPLTPSASDSYTFGYNNRAGVALLLLLVTIGAVWTKGLDLQFRTTGASQPVARKTLIVALIAVFSGCLAMVVLVGRFGGFGESSFGIDRLWLLSQGRTPYVDFEWLFGVALLYGPLMLRNLLHIDLVQAFYLFWILNSLLGILLLYLVINMVDYPTDDKKTIFLLLFSSGFPFILFMGQQYTFVRYLLPLYFILVVHKLLRSDAAKSRVYAALVAVAFTAILLLISPETAIAHAFACACLFLLPASGRRGQSSAIFAGLLLALAAVFYSASKLHVLDSVRASGAGANFFPILFAPHILLFFAALFVCACHIVQRFTQLCANDNTIGLIAYSIPMTAAALGRCDPCHVAWNGLGIFMVSMFYLSNHSSVWKGYKAAFMLVLIFYPGATQTLFYLRFFEKAHLDALSDNSGSSPDNIDLTRLYPSWHGAFLAPLSYQPNGIGSYLSSRVEYGSFEGFLNANNVDEIDAKVAEIKHHPEDALLLPDHFENACQTDVAERRLAIGVWFAIPYFGRAAHPDNLHKPVCDYIFQNYRMEQQPTPQNFGYGLWIAKPVEASR